MMYGAEAAVSGRGTQSPADSDFDDDEPTTLQNNGIDSSDDDDDDGDGSVQKSVKTRELEWDDSTLSY